MRMYNLVGSNSIISMPLHKLFPSAWSAFPCPLLYMWQLNPQPSSFPVLFKDSGPPTWGCRFFEGNLRIIAGQHIQMDAKHYLQLSKPCHLLKILFFKGRCLMKGEIKNLNLSTLLNSQILYVLLYFLQSKIKGITLMGFPDGPAVKNPPAMQGTQEMQLLNPWVRKIP